MVKKSCKKLIKYEKYIQMFNKDSKKTDLRPDISMMARKNPQLLKKIYITKQH